MAKWLAGIAATVIAGILVFWLNEALRSPPPTPVLPQPPPSVSPGDPPASPHAGGGTITVTCPANPHLMHPGNQTELVIQAISSQSAPVSDANVRVDFGGGMFLSPGSTTVIGGTDYGGSFRTSWRSPSPGAKGCVIKVTVSKQDFVAGHGQCRTIIQ